MSAPLVVQGVAVVPLVMERDEGPGAGDHFQQKTPFGVYRVWRARDGDRVHASLMFNQGISSPGLRLFTGDGRLPMTLEEGFALVQEDYSRRISELLAPAEAQPQKDWTIRLSDPRDVCRVCSVLIGAVYDSAEDAAKRVNDKTAWGMSLWGEIGIDPPGKSDGQ